jgi:xylan 1,4-beta-xylosidase
LKKIKQVGDAAQSMSYWVFTDIFEEAGPRFEPFHGGFGMLNIQGINKPVFYAYQYLNRLGETELVNSDSASWACKDEHGNMQVLAYMILPTPSRTTLLITRSTISAIFLQNQKEH